MIMKLRVKNDWRQVTSWQKIILTDYILYVYNYSVSEDSNGGMRMEPTILSSIIARSMALLDGVLGFWTTPVTVMGNTACGMPILHVGLNPCGVAFTAAIAQLVQQSTVMLSGIMAGLSARSG
jgi:hypothetical protein